MSTQLAQLEVRLSPEDAQLARAMALARHGRCLAEGRPSAHGEARRSGLAPDIEGARAELAFARMLGVDLDQWVTDAHSSLGTIRADPLGDVATWQVRSTHHRAGCLIIRRSDPHWSRFALVVTNGVTYRAAGWLRAFEARRPQWWSQPDPHREPAWCVPQEHLRSFQ